MKTLPLLAATALIALMAAPVVAQTTPMTPSPSTNTMPAATPPAATPPATTPDAAMPTAASATDAGTPTSATVAQTVSNGPVPDTPEMRAKYKPLSNAGRRTKPAGN
jgi:hypothetical protein